MSEQPIDLERVQHLLARAREGDRVALGNALEASRHYLRVVANSEMRHRSNGDAEPSDLVQQTLLLAIQGFPSFQGSQPRQFLAWLKSILKAERRSAARKCRRRVALTEDRQVPPGPMDMASVPPVAADVATPEVIALGRERDGLVRGALDRLPPRERSALLWRYGEDMTFGEIGQRLGITEDGARKTCNRAIESIRETLPPRLT
jgi:RNA polymerase sigma-70 factor (ECF subfamily)